MTAGPAASLQHPRAALIWGQGRVRAFLDGTAVDDSTQALLLLEAGHLPVYYFPPQDVRTDVQGDRNSEAPMPKAQAGARRTLPVSPMNRNASTSTMIPTALTTRNAPTAMAAAPSAG